MRQPPRLTTLPNAVRVVTQRVPGAVAAVYLWFDTGAADEPPALAGAAHFIEHLVFKGTARRGVGEAAAEIEDLGGDLNAWTSHDQTVLHATVQADAWRDALDVLADMAWSSTLDPEEVDREREVVLEEIRSYADDPETLVREAGDAALFGTHGYGRPVLGTADTLAGLDRPTLLAHHAAHYVGARTVLVVVGPVEHDTVHAAADSLLGRVPTGTPRPPPAPPPPGQPDSRLVSTGFDTHVVDLAWRTPPLGHPDVPALEVLAAALANGSAAVLPRRLQLDAHLAADVWCDHGPMRDGGSLHVGVMPLPERIDDCLASAIAAVAEIATGGLPGSVIARARNTLAADLAFAGETVDGIAQDLAWYTTHRGDPDAADTWRRELAAVSADDVRRAAARWLAPEDAAVAAVSDRVSVAGLGSLRRAPPPPARRSTGRTGRTLPGGARLVVLPDDGPVVGVRLLCMGGSLDTPARRAGIGAGWSRAVLRGAGGRDATAFGEAADAIGAVFEPTSGRNTVGIGLSLPAEHLDDGLALLGDLVTAPQFDADEWEGTREVLMEDLRTRGDRPAQIASELTWRALWPGHPWRLPPGGTSATLERMGPRALRTFHDRHWVGARLVIGVAGPVDPDRLAMRIGPWIASLDSGAPPAARPTPRHAASGRRTAVAGREQSIVLLATRGLAVHHPDQLALRVAAALLSSQGGRLFSDLREERSLAYSVWCSHITGVDGGLLGAGLATEPGRGLEALRELRRTLARFEDDGPTDSEIARARRMMAGQAAMGLQRAAARAQELATTTLFGLPFGVDAFRQRLAQVDAAAVRRVCRSLRLSEGLQVVVRPPTGG